MTPMNHRAKFDAASVILGGEILNRTKLHTQLQKNKQTNSERYIRILPISMCGKRHRTQATAAILQ